MACRGREVDDVAENVNLGDASTQPHSDRTM
jgi:hypothetical protein